jgi:hypothetical protein
MKRLLIAAALVLSTSVVFSFKSTTTQCEAFSGAIQCPGTAVAGTLYCESHKSWANDGHGNHD